MLALHWASRRLFHQPPRGSGAQRTVEYSIFRIVPAPTIRRIILGCASRVVSRGKVVIEDEAFKGKTREQPILTLKLPWSESDP